MFLNVFLGTLTTSAQVERRGISMGRELDTISRGLGTRIPIHVNKGKRRPEAPMQAAKLASEGGIIIRQHIPIYTNWQEYKKHNEQVKNYIGKLAVRHCSTNLIYAYRVLCILKSCPKRLKA